jgi:hypothetical protein
MVVLTHALGTGDPCNPIGATVRWRAGPRRRPPRPIAHHHPHGVPGGALGGRRRAGWSRTAVLRHRGPRPPAPTPRGPPGRRHRGRSRPTAAPPPSPRASTAPGPARPCRARAAAASRVGVSAAPNPSRQRRSTSAGSSSAVIAPSAKAAKRSSCSRVRAGSKTTGDAPGTTTATGPHRPTSTKRRAPPRVPDGGNVSSAPRAPSWSNRPDLRLCRIAGERRRTSWRHPPQTRPDGAERSAVRRSRATSAPARSPSRRAAGSASPARMRPPPPSRAP